MGGVGVSDTIRINVGPPTRDFIGEIADALACWDHAGMPSIGELSEEMQAAYRELAEKILKHEFGMAGDRVSALEGSG